MAAGQTFLAALIERLTARAEKSAAEVPPVAILWPDEAGMWEPLIPLIRDQLPVITLGHWDQDQLSGPAYWIRCVVDGTLRDDSLPPGVPIVYLPGYARTDIRAVEGASEALEPLAELQYRGAIFAQSNGRDLTINAFLESRNHGLGLEVAADQLTREAILRARVPLATTEIDTLRSGAPLRAPFFDELMSPDLERDVLRWLDDRTTFEAAQSTEQLSAFASRVAERYGVSLADGEIALAPQLGLRGGHWQKVWQRYAEAPARYPHVEELLAAARPDRSGSGSTLFEGIWGSWPQDNEEDENRLRKALMGLRDAGPEQARSRLRVLADEHGTRRDWVWATLGHSPLAFAMEHLARLADATRLVAAPASPDDAMRAYVDAGWQADDSVIRALGCVRTEADRKAVGAAARVVYEPWLDETARRFQQTIGPTADGYMVSDLPEWPPSTCLVFFDGLRLDIGRRLQQGLSLAKRDASLDSRFAALPTITGCAKPAVSPVASKLKPGKFFAPCAEIGGPDLAIGGLRNLLAESGYQVLGLGDGGDPSGRAWTELGDLDEIGHLEPWNLPEQADREVEKLTERICALLDAGWGQVVVVTDHGWLYLPGGLPKVDFPISVTKDDRGRKGRTARLAEGATAPGDTVPWYWDPSVRIAVAPGIATFVGGSVYEHGGISPQECVTPFVTVRNAVGAPGERKIDVSWAGLRARISVSGATAGALVDMRRRAGDPATSVIGQPRPVEADGMVSVLVADEDAQGEKTYVVLLEGDGALLAQVETTVGSA